MEASLEIYPELFARKINLLLGILYLNKNFEDKCRFVNFQSIEYNC